MKSEKIADLLNTTGAFLQLRVFEELEQILNLKNRVEVPYTISGKQGRADILTGLPETLDNPAAFFSFEIKKANSDSKNWVFFRQAEEHLNLFLCHTETSFNQFGSPNQFYLEPWFPGINNLKPNDFELFDSVYELNEEWKSVYRSHEDTAQKAMSQANHALIHSFQNFPRTKSLMNFHPGGLTVFIPIVVTSAKLFEIKIDDFKDINISTGELDIQKLKMEEKNWVVFNYGLEDYLQLDLHNLVDAINYDPNKTSPTPVYPDKRITFVVNSDKFPEFFKNLIKDIYPN